MNRLLLAIALVVTVGCHTAAPPPNLYTPSQLRTQQTESAEQAVIALSAAAINLNALSGPTKLSDQATRYVRDFSLAFDTWRTSYAAGNSTIAQIQTTFATLKTSLATDVNSAALDAALAGVSAALAQIGQ